MTDQQDSRALRDNERVEALLPWLHRNQLSEADQQFIKDSALPPPQLEAELAQENELCVALDAIAAEDAEDGARDADAAWVAFKNRLPDVRTNLSPSVTGSRPVATPNKLRASSWRELRLPRTKVGWLATVQSASLAALALLFIPGQLAQDAPEYTTLSSDSAAASTTSGDAVLVFEPSTSEVTIRELLGSAGAQITMGPMANGGYVISLDGGPKGRGMQILRESDAVKMAEPLNLGD